MNDEQQIDWPLIVAKLKQIPTPVKFFALLVLMANFYFLYQIRDTTSGVVIIGGLLLAATIYLFHLIGGMLSDKAPIEAIASFQIIGGEKSGELSGNAMAHLLRARLGKIRAEMESVTESLNMVAVGSDHTRISSLEQVRSKVTIPDEVFEPLQLDFSVGGVEVGGLMTDLQRLLKRGHLLRIVVQYQEEQAIVAGNIDLFGGRSLYMVSKSDTDEIVTKIAYALAQSEMKERVPETGKLDVDEFRDLMSTLSVLIKLNRNSERNRAVSASYLALVPKIKSLVDKLPNWRPLLRLAAEVSINAKRLEEAVNFYNMELALVDESDPDYDKLRSLTETLTEGWRSDTELNVAAAEPVPNFELLLHRLRKTTALETIYKMLGLSSWTDEEGPRIAILGGLPSEGLLPTSNQVIVGSYGEEPHQRAGEVEYIDSLVQAVRLVASNTVFYFAPMPGDKDYFTYEEVADAWLSLITEKPDVLLMTQGPLIASQFQQLIEESTLGGTLIIVPEIPQEWGLQFGEITQGVMTVAAVGLDGGFLAQSLGGARSHDTERLFWAPGENIPIVVGGDQRVQQRYGHVYASAIAAGVAGRLAACAPSLSVKKRMAILRDSSQVVSVAESEVANPSVINLSAALASAQKILTPQGERLELKKNVEMVIPDNDPTGIISLIEVESVGSLTHIAVELNITHTYIGDLRVSIISPIGQEVILHDRTGGSWDNLITEYTSDETDGLAALINSSITGTWTLHVADQSPQDVGKINNWTLIIGFN